MGAQGADTFFKMPLLRLFVILLAIVGRVRALEASWIPNDENAPLPQSAKYRANLRRICAIMTNGGKLPKSYEERKTVLVKMCAKLMRDDDNVSTAMKVSGAKKVALIIGGVAAGGWVVYNHGGAIKSVFKSMLRSLIKMWGGGEKGRALGGGAIKVRGGSTTEDLVSELIQGDSAAAVRLARLARFEDGFKDKEL